MKNKQFSFNASPMIKARRTKFNTLSHGLKTSMNIGTLYPIYCEEVLPGDTFKVKENHVTRLTSAYIKPPMDMIYQDTYFFFCPSRSYYNRWAEVFGENPNGAWANNEDVSVPGVISPGSIDVGTVADYLTAFPLINDFDLTNNPSVAPSVIPFRAFADIWNYYFRDENVTDPVNIQRGEIGDFEVFNLSDWSPTNYFGKLPKVSKFHDYFTSCLPSPQKGDPVELSLTAGFLPLKASDNITYLGQEAKFEFANNGGPLDNAQYDLGLLKGSFGSTDIFSLLAKETTGFNTSNEIELMSTNLGVNANNIGAVSVNDLRYAFQLQKLLEKDARGGTRLQEYILSHFGVSTPDMRMQVPEFLGGKRVPLNTQQVAQTSSSLDGSDTYLASVGGYSLSNGDSRFSKGFTEHGWIIGVSCLRYHHTYQQGIDRRFLRRNKLDFYDPVFANIGEQPVYKSEIFAYSEFDATDLNRGSLYSLNTDIFGYQEAFADYRFRNNRITGQMRSNIDNSLDVWHFGDNYSSVPTLSQAFIEETPTFVDRTIAVDSDVQDQFIVDYWFDVEAVREMPLYSIPGLVDHH